MFAKAALNRNSAAMCVLFTSVTLGALASACAYASPSKPKLKPSSTPQEAVFAELRSIPSIRDKVDAIFQVWLLPRSEVRDDELARLMREAREIAQKTHRFTATHFPHWTNILLVTPNI